MWIQHGCHLKPVRSHIEAKMSCVHYKFKSSLDYQSVTFDGIHISLGDLKKAIINQKRMKNGEFDLEITNAQNGEGRPKNLMSAYGLVDVRFRLFLSLV